MPAEEKGRRLRVLQERQKQIQLHRYETFVGTVEEVLVEGRGGRESQWKGRTSHNIVLNFTVAEVQAGPVNLGDYWNVRITQAGPNSLVGEAVAGPVDSLGTPAAVAARPGPFSVLQ